MFCQSQKYCLWLLCAATIYWRMLARQKMGWPGSVLISIEPPAGMAHGTEGCSLSLFALAALSGEERFHRFALAALTYERSGFSPQAQNRPDFLEPEKLAWSATRCSRY